MTANIRWCIAQRAKVNPTEQSKTIISILDVLKTVSLLWFSGAKQSDETRGRGGRREEEVAKPLQQPRRKIRELQFQS